MCFLGFLWSSCGNRWVDVDVFFWCVFLMFLCLFSRFEDFTLLELVFRRHFGF